MLHKKLIGLLCLLLLSLGGFAQLSPAETLYPIHQDGKGGYMNALGELVIEPQYDRADVMIGGNALVKKGDLFAIIDIHNKVIVPWNPIGIATYPRHYSEQRKLKENLFVYTDSSGIKHLVDYDLNEIDNCPDCSYRPQQIFSRIIKKKKLSARSKEIPEFDILDMQGKIVFSEKAHLLDLISHKTGQHGDANFHPLFRTQYVNGFEHLSAKFIDLDGNILMDSLGRQINVYPGGYISVERNGLTGVFDYALNPIIDFSEGYESLRYNHRDSLWSAKKDGKYGLINFDNKILIPLIHENFTSQYGPHLYEVGLGMGKRKYLNGQGEIVLDNTHKIKQNDWQEKHLPYITEQEDKNGFLLRDGSFSQPAIYDYLANFSHGKAVYRKGKEYGYVDAKGNETPMPPYFMLGDYANEFRAVAYPAKKSKHPKAVYIRKIEGKKYAIQFNFMNEEGKLIRKKGFDWIYKFNERYGIVSRKGQDYFIDKKGKLRLIGKNLRIHSYFKNGYAIVSNPKGSLFGIIDESGQVILPIEYEAFRRKSEDGHTMEFYFEAGEESYYKGNKRKSFGMGGRGFPDIRQNAIVAKKNGKWGIVNLNNEITIPFEYENITAKPGLLYPRAPLDTHYEMKLKKGDKQLTGFANLDGSLLFSAVYEKLGQYGQRGDGAAFRKVFTYWNDGGKNRGILKLDGKKFGGE